MSRGFLSLAIVAALVTICIGASYPTTRTSAASAEACKAQYKERIGNCANEAIADPSRDPSDFGFWQVCTEKYKSDYDACRSSNASTGASIGAAPPSGCEEAKIAIDWILIGDAGALNSYQRAIKQGKPQLEALLYAQRHNPHAQEMIKKCAGWGVPYAGSIPASATIKGPAINGPGSGGGPSGDGDWDPSCIVIGPVTQNYAQKKAQSADGTVPLWSWTIPVGVNCKKPVRVPFCLHQDNDFIQLQEHIYGPGYLTISPVIFNVIANDPPASTPVWLKCQLGLPCDLRC
ncbi:MAG: hypothetical protein QOK29_4751 [Rhodospirillaceae bacterium]|jgi:hypothetical protein|nr:hypothetical protein [Rhodospirillaceae bacterium]